MEPIICFQIIFQICKYNSVVRFNQYLIMIKYWLKPKSKLYFLYKKYNSVVQKLNIYILQDINMKKSVAINMSGALRTFRYCSKSIYQHIILKLKEQYDVHIFGHFWIFDKKENDANYNMKWKNDMNNYHDDIDRYNFTDICIEKYDGNWESEIINGCYGQMILSDYNDMKDNEEKNNYKSYAVNCMGMYYKIKECNKLIERYEDRENMKFDYIVRLRPDFYWNTDIPTNILNKTDDMDIILVRDSYCIKANWKSNDKFFMGTRKMMIQYCKIYDKLLYFHEKNIRIEGQNIAKEMIKDMNLNIIFFGDGETYDKATDGFIKKREKSLQRIQKLSCSDD